jgi:hypothetical protein
MVTFPTKESDIMGMDVYGNEPTAPEGEYFRRSVWGWHPLADLVLDLCPEESVGCKYWHSNDGAGLGAKDAKRLANALAARVSSGHVAAYIALRNQTIADMANEPCDLCHGTGIRTDAVGRDMKQPEKMIPADATWRGRPHPRAGQKGWCNGCDGRGVNRPFVDSYRVEKDDVVEFIAFLQECGGFKIC